MSDRALTRQDTVVESLRKLGLNNNQAKVYLSLMSLGPSGVAEIHRFTKVHRTKVYEVLRQLAEAGAVEVQSGRPTIYRALPPSVLAEGRKDELSKAASEAAKFLDETPRRPPQMTAFDLAWVFRGEAAIRKKAANAIASAKSRVFIIESYPPWISNSAISLIRSCITRKLRVQVFSVLAREQALGDQGGGIIQFRRISSPDSRRKVDPLTEELLRPFQAGIMTRYAIIVVDDAESLVALPDRQDESMSIGISIKAPGIPLIQRAIFEHLVMGETFGRA